MRNNQKVLLIEDNPGDARLICEMLADVGPGEPPAPTFDLDWVDCLSTGLKRLTAGGVDAILLDLGLPDSQGLDTFTRTQTQAPDVPIVLLTGLDDEAFALEAVRRGAQDYLLKGQVDVNLLSRALCYAIERRRAEAVLRHRNRDLTVLNRLGQELTATLELQQLTERVLQAVIETIDVEGVSIWLWDNGGEGWLVCQAAFPPVQNRSLVNLRLPPGQGIAGWVAQNQESAVVRNVQDDPRFFPRSDEQIGFHTVSLLAVPLRARDRVIGVLEMVNKRQGDFDEDDRALGETLAASSAIAIDNARLVEVLRRNADELEARNQELDAFAHTAAHDLKGPLAKIIGFSEALEDYATAFEEDLPCYLRIIAQNGRKLSNIVDELLLLASVRQMHEVELQPLEMARIVAEAQERLGDMIEARQVEINLPDTWPVALGYGPWVEEVWVNYLCNAIKYGGQPPRVEMGATVQTDGMIRFWLCDNGPGLAREEQVRLFTPFERLDRVRAKGHGLGLSIVKRIVEKLGGQVGVESQVGHGSVFTFSLPATER